MGPAGLAAMISTFRERACLKKENMEKLRTISKINLWPTQPTFSLIHIHACMHTHVQSHMPRHTDTQALTHTHTHIHTTQAHTHTHTRTRIGSHTLTLTSAVTTWIGEKETAVILNELSLKLSDGKLCGNNREIIAFPAYLWH